MFYQETLQRNGPQVGIYESGDIPNAILTEKYVFILTVGVLPDLEKDSYDNADGETYKWYNDEYKVGNIRFYLFFVRFICLYLVFILVNHGGGWKTFSTWTNSE